VKRDVDIGEHSLSARLRANEEARKTTADARPKSVDDFYAYLPSHQYIYIPTRELWITQSVKRVLPPSIDGDRVVAADYWLDKNRAVDQMVWLPGAPKIIEDRVAVSGGGGFTRKDGARIFNLYQPPPPIMGKRRRSIAPWLDLINRLYPSDAVHLIRWFAHRVQRPGEKINHALVLGGQQGIGKDTILTPVAHAVGDWNFGDISPTQLLESFNPFVKSVVLRISEARDLGEINRYAFYEHTKVYMAAPPDFLSCNEKHMRRLYVANVCGVIITTNHKRGGIYLPADDRRHYVAWSDAKKDEMQRLCANVWAWYENGGLDAVAAYLARYPLRSFKPKMPPKRTDAWHAIVESNVAPETNELLSAIVKLKNPATLTLDDISEAAPELADYFDDRRNARQVPHRLEEVGYMAIRNPYAKDRQWAIGGFRVTIYGRMDATEEERRSSVNERIDAGRKRLAAAKRAAERAEKVADAARNGRAA